MKRIPFEVIVLLVLALLMTSRPGPSLIARVAVVLIEAQTKSHTLPVDDPRRIEIEKLKEQILCASH